MQNFGPVHIEKNIEHAAIVDASTNITLAPSHTIVEVSAQNNAMYEYGFFDKMDIDKKDVFAAFAAMIHDPRIAKYSTDLNRAKAPYSDPEVNTRIFDALRDTSKEYFDK